MNKYQILYGLVMLCCLILVGFACSVRGAAWYVWLIALSANAGIMYLCNKDDWPKKKSTKHEQHLRCARASWNFAGTVGLTSVILDVMGGVFGDIVIFVISLSVIWLSLVHFADKNGKFLWWLGWLITMSLAVVEATLGLLSHLGVGISKVFEGGLLVLIFLSCAVTLVIGIVLYVYPPIKEIYEDVKEIRNTIKPPATEDDD